jgi:hypothetical protein
MNENVGDCKSSLESGVSGGSYSSELKVCPGICLESSLAGLSECFKVSVFGKRGEERA